MSPILQNLAALLNHVKHGGPYLTTITILATQALSILVLHFLFQMGISLLADHTHFSRQYLNRVARFMPTCLGLMVGMKLTEDTFDFPSFVTTAMDNGFHSLVIISVTLFIAHVISTYIRYRLRKSTSATASTSILATVVDFTIYTMGFLAILNSYGISISPLLTALGAGGLASALALKDTLTNLFSGISTLVSKQIHIGDYIQLPSGRTGRIIDMNWHHTTIRTVKGNTVIVPNANISNSDLINYERPYPQCTIGIPVTIAYGNDLDFVEKVTLDTANAVLASSEYGVRGFKPVVRYNALGDYGISLDVVLQIRKVVDESALRHQFIKALYKAYGEHHIPLMIRHD